MVEMKCLKDNRDISKTSLKIGEISVNANISKYLNENDVFRKCQLEEELQETIKKSFNEAIDKRIIEILIKWGFVGDIKDKELLKQFIYENNIYLNYDKTLKVNFLVNEKLKEVGLVYSIEPIYSDNEISIKIFQDKN